MNKSARTAGNGETGQRRRATSYDVAELAGVSQSAVSRVFQQGASASKEMRDRVMAAVNKPGYRPNAIARGLITQRSNLVAVVIPQQTNLYYPEFLVQLPQRFSEHGVRVLLLAFEVWRQAPERVSALCLLITSSWRQRYPARGCP